MYRRYFGYVDVKEKRPAAADTIYRMMSMTKPITAVAVMQLIEQGAASLDDPVSRYLPEFAGPVVSDDPRYTWEKAQNPAKLGLMLATFSLNKVKTRPAAREITIRDLLAHTF